MNTYKAGKLINMLHASDIVTHRGIPVPEPRAASNIPLYNAARALEVGDCLDIPYSRNGAAFNLARDTGYTFTQRKIGNILRIWRTQ